MVKKLLHDILFLSLTKQFGQIIFFFFFQKQKFEIGYLDLHIHRKL